MMTYDIIEEKEREGLYDYGRIFNSKKIKKLAF